MRVYMVISLRSLTKIMHIILFLLFLQLVNISCKKKPGEEQGPAVLLSSYQLFVLTVTAEQKNINGLKEIAQKELLPLLGGIKEIRSFKVFNSSPGTAESKFIIFLEMRNADKKGITLDDKGHINKIDFSQFMNADFKNTPSFKNLLSLKNLIKEYEVRACSMDTDLLIDRETLGYVRSK